MALVIGSVAVSSEWNDLLGTHNAARAARVLEEVDITNSLVNQGNFCDASDSFQAVIDNLLSETIMYSSWESPVFNEQGTHITWDSIGAIIQNTMDLNDGLRCVSCSNICIATCTGNCANSCSGNCATGCGNYCTSCSDSWAWGCVSNCGFNCSGTGSCKGSCNAKCTNNCNDKCNTGCSDTCQLTCSLSCISDCSNSSRIGVVNLGESST